MSLNKALAWVALVSMASTASALPISYDVSIDTSSLAGTTGALDFNFNPGLFSSQDAVLQLESFTGGTPSGSAELTGSAAGALPGTVTLGNESAFNDYFQDVLFGTTLSFRLDLSGPALSSPDGTSLSGSAFAFSLFSDAAGTIPALTGDDIDGFAFTLGVNLDGTTTVSDFSSQTSIVPAAPATAVPEPDSLLLSTTALLLALAAMGLRGSRRIRGSLIRVRARTLVSMAVAAALAIWADLAPAQTVREPPAQPPREAPLQPLAQSALGPSAIPAFWTCSGNCGTDGADGVVPLSPTGNANYEWVSTSGGISGVGVLPAGRQGNETDGSTLATPIFSATAGTTLNFYFDYITSDGAGFADYAWAELYDSANNPVALLFTARTEASGSIVPGTALPAPAATLTPASVPIVPGGPVWPQLGSFTGRCFASGCGFTGWVKATYVIPTTGNYYLKVGAVNWLDGIWDSGLAVDGVSLDGVPITLLSGTLDVEYGINAAKTTWVGLASATDNTGKPLDMQSAAHQLGYDHFNWLQLITDDLQIEACQGNPSLAGCAVDFTITGTVPDLPTPDPAEGGYAYELCTTGIGGCVTSFPVSDFWPMYLDEFFASLDDVHNKVSPDAPEYLRQFRAGNSLKHMGANNQDPAHALGFSFSDSPDSSSGVPGSPGTAESITFLDALVGVSGKCNVLVSSNCTFAIIPGTTFQWTATGGVVSATFQAGGPGNPPSLSPLTQGHRTKLLDDFPVDPTDLTGQELASSLITVDQFMSRAHLTPQQLAAMGGSIATQAATLVPNQAAALAAVQAGGTLVPASQVTTTTSGLTFSRVTQTFSGTLALTNVSSNAIKGPLQILIKDLPISVTLANAAGNFSGIPYLTLPTASLSPGQTVTATVRFKNPTNAIINMTPEVYSGAFK